MPLNRPFRLHNDIRCPSRLGCCLFAGSRSRPHRWRGGMADIETAAVEGDRDLVLLLIISDPTSANQRIDEYDTQP